MIVVLVLLFFVGLLHSNSKLSLSYFPKDLQRTLCTYMVTGGLVHLATEITKAYVGYLRPFFYEHCQPSEDFSQYTNPDYSEDIRRSFPSGHASVAFATMTLFSLYLDGRFGVRSAAMVVPHDGKHNDKEYRKLVAVMTTTPTRRQRLVSVLSLLPIGLALYIASSRIVDNAHFPADVMAGSLIGFGIAKFTHGLW